MVIDFKEAVDLMKQGKEEGFNKLYSSTYQMVYARAKQCTKTEEDARDLTQIVYIEAFKNINKLSAPEATLSWLFSICYHKACSMYRGEREKRETLLATEEETVFDMVESIDISTMPELSVDQKATAEIVREIIEELPELQKMTILSFYFDEMKIEQIADMMDCSTNTVKSRLNYARKFIKDKVEEHEKKGGYKLHAITIPTLLWALKFLTDKTTITVHAAESIYAESCTALGLKASSLALAGAGTAGSNATISTSTATATATKTAAAAGGKIGTAKALVIAAAVTVGGVGTIGGVYMYQHSQPVIVEEVETDDTEGLIDGTGITEDLNGREESVDESITLQDDLSSYMYLVKLVDIGNGRLEVSSNPQDRIYPKKISDNEYRFVPAATGKLFEYGEYVEFQGYNMPAGISYSSFMYGDTIGDFQMVEGVDGLNEGNNGTIAIHLDTQHDVIVKLK